MSAILLYFLHNVSSFLPVYLSSDKYMITIFASGHNNIMVIQWLTNWISDLKVLVQALSAS